MPSYYNERATHLRRNTRPFTKSRVIALLVAATLVYLSGYYLSEPLISMFGKHDTSLVEYIRTPASTKDFERDVHESNEFSDPSLNAEIGKVTMSYGTVPPIYERALSRQVLHGELHGYKTFVLRSKIMPRLWSKPAYILSIILQELEKPKEDRLKWLL
jgi:hypothetical protein